MEKSMTIALLALLAMSSFAFLAKPAGADTVFERTWVRAHGRITEWGLTPVFGWINVRVKAIDVNGTFREWAGVHAVWSYEPRRLNCTDPPTGTFTFTFWTARLVNSSVIAANYSGYDLFISGKWNVNKITTTVEVSPTGEVSITRVFEPTVTEAYGELRVFPEVGERRLFELSITGIDLLSGVVVRYVVQHLEIEIFDTDDNGKVTIVELTRAAKRYGSVAGLWNYDADLDVNGDCKIDIADLATLAANIKT